MKINRFFVIIAVIAGGLLPLCLAWRAAPPAAAAPATLDADLQAALADAPPDAAIRILIHAHGRSNLAPASLPAATLARRTAVVSRLQETAAAAQSALRQQLDALAQSGAVSAVRPFWIVNAIAATATPAAIHALAARPDVARIALDHAFPLVAPPQLDLPDANPLSLAPRSPLPAPPWGITQIRAPHAWHGLGVDGSGVTVAIVDTGVDWLHPDLYPNYRGNLGSGEVNHAGSWYHAADPSITTPVDPFGHGTHVAGTAVGQHGLGVAPGARWIAVALSDASGLIYDSAVHAAFQWLLAPNDEPGLAPDVVNNSWSNLYGNLTTYLADVQALQAAGIVPLFAAGNRGPTAGTVGSPASYTNTLAIGASDDVDGVAWFSSRGPSPITAQPKPHLVAPGTRTRSAFPGAQYAVASGTSMATPHASGAVALLLSANPGLTPSEVMDLLANTAVPLTPTHPNPDSGYGRLDAYAAAAAAFTGDGRLAGRLYLDGAPLPGAVVTVTTPAGVPLAFVTDANGRFNADLRPGSYALAVAPFGVQPYLATNLQLFAGQTTSRILYLSRLPTGAVSGQVHHAGSGAPIAGATVSAAGTPASTQTDANGRYTLPLPAGAYDVAVSRNGYRVLSFTAQISPNQTHLHDAGLSPAPSILLVDAGPWLFSSEIGYLQAALRHDRRSYDLWSVRNPLHDVPTLADVSRYDVLIWSDPFGSPGRIAANNVITDYLGGGGHVIVSGQEVGRYDGTGFGNQVWWRSRLHAQFVGELVGEARPAVAGIPGTPFAGLTLTLNGPDSAANQLTPDVSLPEPWALTEPILSSTDGSIVGLQAGACTPYRLIYFGFGLEGVAGTADRAALLARSFDALAAPPRTTGVRWLAAPVDDLALPGSTLTYTLTLQNLSETLTDTFDLRLLGSAWPGRLVTPTLTLPPCGSAQTILSLTVPTELAPDAAQVVTLTAVSRQSAHPSAALSLRHKTPGRLLLVDADRFYEHEGAYTAALAALDAPFDTWDVGGSLLQPGRGSPPAALLNAYDFVLWFTGNDWYEPVSPADRGSLLGYLQQGGRLFLSSQDFLYYPMAAEWPAYLGMLGYKTDVTPTQVTPAGIPGIALTGTQPINYDATRNQGDGVKPGAGQPYLWHNKGFAAALFTAGENWRTSFWSIPFERLPAAARDAAMNDVLGWLSDLGGSGAALDARSGAPGVTRTLVITVHNWAGAPTNQVVATASLPAGLRLLPGTLSGATANPDGQLFWQGELAPGEIHLIRAQVQPDAGLPPGTRLDTAVTLWYARHDLRTRHLASLWISAPDLRATTLRFLAGNGLPARTISATLVLRNQGDATAAEMSATVRLPEKFRPRAWTLHATAGTATVTRYHVHWHGSLLPGEVVTVSLQLVTVQNVAKGWFLSTVTVRDGVTDPLVRSTRLWLPPYQAYLPAAFRAED